MITAERTVFALLEKLAEEGLDHGQLEAVMANTEFKLRERDYGYYPQGLIFGFNVLESWLYGGDPIDGLRFEEAKRRATATSETFTAISERLGFESIHYFTRFFKKMSGMSPKAYRMAHSKKEDK